MDEIGAAVAAGQGLQDAMNHARTTVFQVNQALEAIPPGELYALTLDPGDLVCLPKTSPRPLLEEFAGRIVVGRDMGFPIPDAIQPLHSHAHLYPLVPHIQANRFTKQRQLGNAIAVSLGVFRSGRLDIIDREDAYALSAEGRIVNPLEFRRHRAV